MSHGEVERGRSGVGVAWPEGSSEVMIGAGKMCRDDRAVSQHLEAVYPGRYLALGAPSFPDAWSLPARA